MSEDTQELENHAHTDHDLTLADPGIIAMAQRADRLVQALKQIRAAVLKLTNERDWENLGGTPYLNEGGAKKVGTAFGVSWQLEEPTREDHEDGHYSYTVAGNFEFRGTAVQEIGTRSSRDDFFAKAKGKALPITEIDRNDVKKSAVTNCIGRGVKSLLALKNFTWEELHLAGIDKAKVSTVEYSKGSDDPNAPAVIPWGEHKGKAITEVEESVLLYVLKGVEKSIGDAEKAPYKAKNERLRDALKVEIARRENPAQEDCAGQQTAKDEFPAQQANDAPVPFPTLTFQEICDRLPLAQSIREYSELMNASLNSHLTKEQAKTVHDLGEQAKKRLGRK